MAGTTRETGPVKGGSIYVWANPDKFVRLADRLLPWFAGLTLICLPLGLLWGLFYSPPDYQQGETVRILYLHVPSAWMALTCYTAIAIFSFIGFVLRHPLADSAARAMAPIGAAFTLVMLITGALWGKPTWGTYWVWDARLTSALILFFLYLGYMALWQAIEDQTKAARAAAVLAMVGFINVPIIKFSVDWWNSLHQPASIVRLDGPTMHPSMLTPLLICVLGFTALGFTLHLIRLKTHILERRMRRLAVPEAPAAVVVEQTPAAQGGSL